MAPKQEGKKKADPLIASVHSHLLKFPMAAILGSKFFVLRVRSALRLWKPRSNVNRLQAARKKSTCCWSCHETCVLYEKTLPATRVTQLLVSATPLLRRIDQQPPSQPADSMHCAATRTSWHKGRGEVDRKVKGWKGASRRIQTLRPHTNDSTAQKEEKRRCGRCREMQAPYPPLSR